MNLSSSTIQPKLIGIYQRITKQQVRFRNVINTRKPRPMHFWYQNMEQATKVKLPPPYDIDFPKHLKCKKIYENMKGDEAEENPYERILANETIDLMNKSKMILLLHRNPCHGYYFYESFNIFRRKGMTLVGHGRSTIAMAVENTKFANIPRLYETHTMMLCSPDVQLNLVYSLLKTTPFYILLAGIVEDRFLNRRLLDEYSKVTDIQENRYNLSQILNTAASALVNNIGLSANTTVSLLHQHEQALKTNNDRGPTANEETKET